MPRGCGRLIRAHRPGPHRRASLHLATPVAGDPAVPQPPPSSGFPVQARAGTCASGPDATFLFGSSSSSVDRCAQGSMASCERRHPSVLSRPTHSPTRELSSSPRESCTPALGTSRPDTHPEGARTNERPVQGSALCLTLYTVCNLILIDGRASPREPPHRQEPRGPAAARGRGARAEGARCTAPLSSGEDLSHTHPPPPPRRKPYLLRLAEAS